MCIGREGLKSRRHTAVHRGRVQSGGEGVKRSVPRKENARKGQEEAGPQLSMISEKALDKGRRPKVIKGVILWQLPLWPAPLFCLTHPVVLAFIFHCD